MENYKVGERYTKRLICKHKIGTEKCIYMTLADENGIELFWKARYGKKAVKYFNDNLYYNFTIRNIEDNIIWIERVIISAFQPKL